MSRAGLTVLALAGLGLAGALDGWPHPLSRAHLAALALSAVVLEAFAVRLPGRGLHSAAPAVYLAAMLDPGTGASGACLVLMAALACRTALFHRLDRPFQAALGDLVPGAWAAVVAAGLGRVPMVSELVLLRGAAALEAYLLVALAVEPWLGASDQDRKAWGRIRSDWMARFLAIGSVGVGLVYVLRGVGPWHVLWWVPGLLVVQRTLRVLSPPERQLFESRLSRQEATLAQATEAETRVRRQLFSKVEELTLLERLAGDLARSRDLPAACQVVFGFCRRVIPEAQSLALFRATEGGLEPVACQSPHAERVEARELLLLGEPLLGECWSQGRVAIRSAPPGEGALFPDEGKALASPLSQEGVLYVGCAGGGGFSAEQLHLLAILSGQAASALQSARHIQAQEEALRYHAEAHEHLQRWVEGLSRLLDGLPALPGKLDPDEILERLAGHLTRLAPHQSRLAVLREEPGGPGSVKRYWVDDPAAAPGPEDRPRWEAAMVALMERVCQARRPLLVDDVATTSFEPLARGHRSLLAVPILNEAGTVGLLAVGAQAAAAFNRGHQEVLFLLAFHVGVWLENAGLHRSVVKAYQRLAESEAELLQSSKLAAVGQLAAGVAHELNNPLGAILLGVGTALRQPGSQLAEQLLGNAQTAAVRARSIVEKLLYYSRDARVGRLPSDLNRIVGDTLELIGPQLGMDEIQISCGLAPEELSVLCNQNEIQQVLVNLLLNARDAVLAGEPPRQIILRTAGEGGRAVVRVEDTGPGVPEEIRDRIFDPFFTTKPVGKGTGLGLSVSQRIVSAHDGDLRLEDRDGAGACFRMNLPRA